MFNGKISVESHLQQLINLGYNHNGTIDWGKDKDNFGNSLAKFLSLFQEILDAQAANQANELLAKQTQIAKAQETQKDLETQKTTKESQKAQESKPSNSKQEKMNTFLNNLLKVS